MLESAKAIISNWWARIVLVESTGGTGRAFFFATLNADFRAAGLLAVKNGVTAGATGACVC